MYISASSVKLDSWRVSAANDWDVELNTGHVPALKYFGLLFLCVNIQYLHKVCLLVLLFRFQKMQPRKIYKRFTYFEVEMSQR